jgi:hypothetical protein
MSDVDLALLPHSRVAFRLGYSHNNKTTRGGLRSAASTSARTPCSFNPWNKTINSYRIGLDWKIQRIGNSIRVDCHAANDPENPLMANSFYTNHTHFGMATVRVKPVKRVTANMGYSITGVDGSIPQFNILQPPGSS